MLISRSELPGQDHMGLAREEEEAVGHSVDLIEGTNCQQTLHVMPHQMSPKAFLRKACSRYVLGVENLFSWASARPRGRANFCTLCNALRRLGKRE